MAQWIQNQFNIDFSKDVANFRFTSPGGGAISAVNIPFKSSDDQTQQEAAAAATQGLRDALQELLDHL